MFGARLCLLEPAGLWSGVRLDPVDHLEQAWDWRSQAERKKIDVGLRGCAEGGGGDGHETMQDIGSKIGVIRAIGSRLVGLGQAP